MGEDPAADAPPPKKGRSKQETVGIVLASIAAGGVVWVLVALYALGADFCCDPGPPAHVLPVPAAGGQPVPPAESSDAINIAGIPVEFVDGTVTSACFTFVLPREFEMDPDSIGCQVALRPLAYDSLLEIDVRAQSGDNSAERFFDAMAEAMAATWPPAEYSTETVLVDGRPTPLAHTVNKWGVRTDYYQVPVDFGALESDGTAITSILILLPDFSSESGFSSGNGFDQLATNLIDSFTVRD